MSDAIPVVAENGQWRHTDGNAYVLRSVALAMGFTPPFLLKYRSRRHPALGRPLTIIKKALRTVRSNGVVVQRDLAMYLLTDLERIAAARQADGADVEGWPTLSDAAKNAGRTWGALNSEVRSGNVRSRPGMAPRMVRTRLKGRQTTFVQFAKVRFVHPDDLARQNPAGKISLPDAARKSGIPLATWHTWTRFGCPLLGRNLDTQEERGRTAHGHYRTMDHIDLAEYEAVVARWNQADAGRVQRDDGAYLSPATADKDFDLGATPNTPLAVVLNNRKHHPSPALGRPIRTTDGHYLDGKGKLTHGQLFHEQDLELLFRRKRPAPPTASPPAAKAAPTIDPPAVNGVQPNPPRHAGEQGGAKGRGGRPRDPLTAQVYEFCYVEYVKNDRSASVVRRRAKDRFGSKAPKEDADVIRGARRHAERSNLPWK